MCFAANESQAIKLRYNTNAFFHPGENEVVTNIKIHERTCMTTTLRNAKRRSSQCFAQIKLRVTFAAGKKVDALLIILAFEFRHQA